MDDAASDTLAEALDTARRTRQGLASIVERYPGLRLADACAVSARWARLRDRQGAVRRGYKVGLTSHDAMRRNGLAEPILGVLFDDMVGPADGGLASGRYIAPRIEVELAFVMGAVPPTRAWTTRDLLAATQYVLPAVEVVDARVRKAAPGLPVGVPILDVVADNANGAGVLLGSRRWRPTEIDLAGIGCTLSVNGEHAGSGDASNVLGDPLRSLLWLAQRLRAQGEALREGDLVMSGAFFGAMAVQPGDVVSADFGGLGALGFQVT